MSSIDLSIVLLAKNEKDNLIILVPKIIRIISKLHLNYEIIVVGANVDNDTSDICTKLGCKYFVQSAAGFGRALKEGARACEGEKILTMDADLQHDPMYIPKLLETNADLVIGSRWVGRKRINLSLHRRILSLGLNILFSIFLGISVKDMSSNYRLYRNYVIRDMNIEGRNFDVLPEILMKSIIKGFNVLEVPVSFNERTSGQSNLALALFMISYLQTLLRLFQMRCYHYFSSL